MQNTYALLQYLGNTYCTQTYKHIQFSADSEHFFCFTEELKSDLGKNVSYPTWYETSIVILNDNPQVDNPLGLFFRFTGHLGLGLNALFVQYYSVICRLLDHTVGRPRTQDKRRKFADPSRDRFLESYVEIQIFS